MVMGPTHSMSGAGFWLVLNVAVWSTVAPLPVVLLGAAVCAGAALMNDFDCPGSLSTEDGSTAVRAFGPVGEVIGHSTDALSLMVYDLTRTKKDGPRESGHRTLTHTFAFAALMSVLVSSGASLPGTFEAFGRSWATGTVFTLAVLWACLHLALFGLVEKPTKKFRRKYGLLAVMLVSGVLTAGIAAALPADQRTFPWLGLAVGAGFLIHDFGDAITRAGVPLLWPFPHRGKRWWEWRIPMAFAIRAGGTAEKVFVFPATVGVTVWALVEVAVPGFWKGLWHSVKAAMG